MTGQPDDPKKQTPKNPETVEDAGAAEQNENLPDEQPYNAAQLRMARRKARRLGLNPANGVQAIEMLRERGIDLDDQEPSLTDSQAPIDQTRGKRQAAAPNPDAGNALMTQKSAGKVPAAQVLGAQPPAIISKEERQKEIAKLEKKIKKRRDDRMRKLLRRFFLFVLLPTLVMGYYYYFVATPLYGADTEMKVEQASAAATGPAGGLLAGTPFATQNDAIAVQGYLNSRDAFSKLENDYPFDALFSGDKVDRFLRLDEDANEEERYGVYKDQIKVSYDNTDQVLRMEVRTPDAQSAVDISKLLLSYAEDRVDEQTQRVRDTGVQDAEFLLQEKAAKLEEAQIEIFNIQELQGTLSPVADKEALVAQIQELRAQLTQSELTLRTLLANPSPNQIRVRAERANIKRIQDMIDSLTAEGTEVDDQGASIARLDQQMRIAETKLLLAQNEYEMASANLQTAEAEARSQRRFVTTSLPPTSTFEPVYPKKFLSTASVFMVFFALYIIVSITIEVIREQVSA